MPAPADTILPTSYFDAVSTLWGGCAYLGGGIAAAGFSLSAAFLVRRREPTELVMLVFKVVFIGLATAFLRDWLLRLNDVIGAFNDALGVDPAAVATQYLDKVKGLTGDPKSSIWDVIWKTASIGTALAYSIIWIFGWLAWGVQYFARLIGDIMLTMGWALSPVFLSFFMLRPMADVARKYVVGLVAVTCWPFGWTVAAVATKALMDLAATASLTPVLLVGDAIGPVIVALLIGLWILVSSPLAPFVITKALLMGANPAAAMAGAVGGVAQAGVAGAMGAAATAATGGAAAPAVIAAALAGGAAAAGESSARGGGAARLSATVAGGIGSYAGARYARRSVEAMETNAAAMTVSAAADRDTAAASQQHAQAARDFARAHETAAGGVHRAAAAQEDIAETLRGVFARKRSTKKRPDAEQPHQENPNEIAAIIARRARSHLTLTL